MLGWAGLKKGGPLTCLLGVSCAQGVLGNEWLDAVFPQTKPPSAL